jgi:hypothetical protein
MQTVLQRTVAEMFRWHSTVAALSCYSQDHVHKATCWHQRWLCVVVYLMFLS